MTESQEISRVSRSRESARVAYDRMSGFYDLVAGTSERHFTGLGLKMLGARPGEDVLEIGSGTGHSLVALAQAVTRTGSVLGVDLSGGMLHTARVRLRRSGWSEHVTCLLGDAASLPFGTSSFDAVFSSFTLELFDTPEIPVVLQGCLRVLKAEGRIGIVALAKDAGAAVRIYEWVHSRLPDYADCRPIYVHDQVEKAGFIVTERRKMCMWGLPVEILVARKWRTA